MIFRLLYDETRVSRLPTNHLDTVLYLDWSTDSHLSGGSLVLDGSPFRRGDRRPFSLPPLRRRDGRFHDWLEKRKRVKDERQTEEIHVPSPVFF